MRTRPYLRTLIYHAQGNGITFPLASTHLLSPIIWEIGIGVQLYGISVSLSDTVEMGYGLVRLPSIFWIWNQKRLSVSVVVGNGYSGVAVWW